MRVVSAVVLFLLAASPAWAQKNKCEEKWTAIDTTKGALADCLKSGKSCKAEFAAVDGAKAALGECGERPAPAEEDVSVARPTSTPANAKGAEANPIPVATPWAPRAVAATNPAGSADDDMRVGAGFAFSSGRVLALSQTRATRFDDGPLSIRVPFRGARMRFEPEIGFDRDRVRESLGGAAAEFVVTTFRIGAGVHWLSRRKDDAAILYFGPRLGIDSISIFDEVDDGAGTRVRENGYRTDFFAALAFGAEHHFSPRFSVGAEAQIVASYLLAAGVTGASEVDTSGNAFSTQGAVLFRWYY